jgi:hypothetical protein
MTMPHPRAQHRMTAWIECADDLPAIFDGPILVYFRTGSIETVNCMDYFADITAGTDEEGNPTTTRWYLEQGVTHWALVPHPPHH